jgi:predicted neutral ceramidase superfamily lipid hydrolase
MMKSSYFSLGLQTLISGIIMYLVMFVMIDGIDSFYNNLNMFYMTLMMVAPMVVLMILAMAHMFKSKAANVTLLAVSFVAFFGSFALIRTQTTIGDRAFLRSMIPHHSGAILMCQEASLSDPEIVKLCGNIIKSQREEIDQMKAILARSNR